jgi:glycosyltransferase involved in cell wall biosynthesis
MGHDLLIYTCDGQTGLDPYSILERKKIRVVPNVRYFQWILAKLFYFIYILIDRPDSIVIYFGCYGESIPVRILKLFKKVDVTFIVGYPYELTPHRFHDFKKNRIFNKIDNIIVKSESMVKDISNFFEKEVFLIENGVDTKYFHKENTVPNNIRRLHKIPKNATLLLTVAALEKRKGIQSVISSMERIGKNENIFYIILGEGPDRKILESIIRNSQVKNKIILAGSKESIIEYYDASDAFLLLSDGEGYPNVILEAWAMEIPVIVSTSNPYPIITKGTGSILISINDETKLDITIKKIMNDKEYFNSNVKKSREYVVNKMDWNHVIDKYENVLLCQ